MHSQHPAITGQYLTVSMMAAFVGTLLVLASAAPDRDFVNLAAGGTILGYFLVAVAVVSFSVHAVSQLLYQQELMRSSLRDPDPEDE